MHSALLVRYLESLGSIHLKPNRQHRRANERSLEPLWIGPPYLRGR
jgi:hypothetical protein